MSDGEDALELEREYRRGYWDGFYAAVEAMEKSCRPGLWSKFESFVFNELTSWKDEWGSGCVEPPTSPTDRKR